MATADELLKNLTTQSDPEGHIVISGDRFITVPENLKRLGVQHDHNIETVTFDCPRYWDDHDMSTMTVYINYMLSNGYSDRYIADNVTADEDIMHFEWTISRNVTQVPGTVSFLVCVMKTDVDGNEERHWNSEVCQDCSISPGMECTEVPIDTPPDVVTQLLLRMDSVEEKVDSVEKKAVPDDSVVGEKTWSSKNTVDKLCPEFEKTGDVVSCYPVEGYPLTVETHIKNLFNSNYETKTYSGDGVTFEVNDDGSIVLTLGYEVENDHVIKLHGDGSRDVGSDELYYGVPLSTLGLARSGTYTLSCNVELWGECANLPAGAHITINAVYSGRSGYDTIATLNSSYEPIAIDMGSLYGQTGKAYADEVFVTLTIPSGYTDAGIYTIRLMLEEGSVKHPYIPYGEKPTITHISKNHFVQPYYGVSSGIKNGINITVNDDYSITLDTAGQKVTKTTYFNLMCRYLNDYGEIIPVTGLVNGDVYTVSMGTTLPDGVYMQVLDDYFYESELHGKFTFTFNSNVSEFIVYLIVQKDTVLDNLTLYPMLEKGMEATAYEPFRKEIVAPEALVAWAGENALIASSGDITVSGREDPAVARKRDEETLEQHLEQHLEQRHAMVGTNENPVILSQLPAGVYHIRGIGKRWSSDTLRTLSTGLYSVSIFGVNRQIVVLPIAGTRRVLYCSANDAATTTPKYKEEVYYLDSIKTNTSRIDKLEAAVIALGGSI